MRRTPHLRRLRGVVLPSRRRLDEERIPISDLHRSTEVEHHHSIAHVLDNCEIVGNEEIRKTVVALEAAQQVENLSLHRNVK